MIRPILLCLSLILSHAVAAQAAPEIGVSRIDTDSWVVTHQGFAELDSMPVTATFEMIDTANPIDSDAAPFLQPGTLAPVVPLPQKGYRLSLVSAEIPSLRAVYDLHPMVTEVEGEPRLAFLSQENPQGVRVYVLAEKNGSYSVELRRNWNRSDSEIFQLEPVPHILED